MIGNKPATKELSELIAEINSYVKNNDWRGLDGFISGIRIEGTPVAELLTWLRSIYPFRNKLKNWKPLRAQVEEYFDRLEIPTAKLLKGL